MTDTDLDPRLRTLLDRQEIVDCLLRYTRGLDRLDLDLFRSAFHPDALDSRSGGATTIDEFLDSWLPKQPDRDVTQHFITNHMIDIDGDVAHVETYHLVAVKLKQSPELSLHAGRYADRLERRDGEWRIAVRLAVPSWHGLVMTPEASEVLSRSDWSRRSKEDPTYERPLLPR
jgi:hypothetical protein